MTARVVTFRPAEMQDIPALDDLLTRSYSRLLRADYPPSVMVTVMPLLARAQPALIRSGRYHGAFAAGRLAGCGGWTFAPPGGGPARPGEAHLRHVAVDPDMVRQGVGGGLLRFLLDDMSGQGVGRVHAAATRTAVPFYRAGGFAAGAEVVATLRPGIEMPLVPMVLDL
ncbi:GNAT family N-acetyltransferase [Salipiger sp.]|uniref:GNAT family N-acetyltransferase n=1 Tax=Salipiger sp. TaxID=2078585 RepID=UPI003A973EC3